MTISELIAMCERRLVHLQAVKSSAVSLGDLAQVDALDTEISETQQTLNALRAI